MGYHYDINGMHESERGRYDRTRFFEYRESQRSKK